ncbi:MAG: CatA-like O-acetyltransferase, partial [Ruminococcus sp.]|nr:CatA-like O-acetyltransferase [Ruminococcus sp.]
MFRKIDVHTWERKTHYEIYRQFANARYDITLELDVTNLVKYVKENHLSFTLTMIHTIAKCANEIDEFRMRIENDEPVIYDKIDLSFTYLNKEANLMKNVVAENDANVFAFNRKAKAAIEKQNVYFTGPLGNGIYQFSSIPWISYTHISHTFSGNKNYAVPVFDFGKFHEKNGRLVMPFSIEVH